MLQINQSCTIKMAQVFLILQICSVLQWHFDCSCAYVGEVWWQLCAVTGMYMADYVVVALVAV